MREGDPEGGFLERNPGEVDTARLGVSGAAGLAADECCAITSSRRPGIVPRKTGSACLGRRCLIFPSALSTQCWAQTCRKEGFLCWTRFSRSNRSISPNSSTRHPSLHQQCMTCVEFLRHKQHIAIALRSCAVLNDARLLWM